MTILHLIGGVTLRNVGNKTVIMTQRKTGSSIYIEKYKSVYNTI